MVRSPDSTWGTLCFQCGPNVAAIGAEGDNKGKSKAPQAPQVVADSRAGGPCMPAAMPFPTVRPTRVALWTLLVIALIGATRIPEPFEGDQALFTLTARSLLRGARLYVDV